MENKILGIKWDKFKDVFIFNFNEIREKFEALCSAKYDWDDLITDDYLT